VKWLRDRGKIIHGWYIIWSGLPYMPKDGASLTNNPAGLRKRVFGRSSWS
jgi:hypothetical protein